VSSKKERFFLCCEHRIGYIRERCYISIWSTKRWIRQIIHCTAAGCAHHHARETQEDIPGTMKRGSTVLYRYDTVGAQEYDYAMSILHNDYRVN
jgi:hypothetical protein